MKCTAKRCRLLAAGALSAALLLASLLAAGPASAQARNPEAEAACTPDVMRLCSQFIPEQRRIVACLRAKRQQLGSECRRFMTRKVPRRG